MKKNNFIKVIKNIILIQICSDMAKEYMSFQELKYGECQIGKTIHKKIYEEEFDFFNKYFNNLKYNKNSSDLTGRNYFYMIKDNYIKDTIKLLNKEKNNIFNDFNKVNFFVKKEKFNNIIYFNIKINNKKYQISFHNFDKEIKGQGTKCHWQKKISSQESCVEIIKQLKLFEQLYWEVQ